MLSSIRPIRPAEVMKLRLLACVCLAATVLCLNGCQEAPWPVSEIRTSHLWQQHPDNPIIRMGDMRTHGNWNDPSVLKENGYVMYMTTNEGKPFETPVLPFRAVSRDGVHWRLSPKTPLLSNQGTDFVKIETPSVVKFQDRYHMFFTGVYSEGQVPTMAIGHGISSNGIHWKLSNGGKPVLAGTGTVSDWNGYAVAEPGAVVFNDKIYVYYGATGARTSGRPPQLQVIALATTTDGVHFSPSQIVLRQDEQLYPPEQGYCGYSTPSALVVDDNVHLFFDVAQFRKGANPEWVQVALDHATSKDGLNFVLDDLAIVKRGEQPWIMTEVRSPALLLEGDQVKMWYAGHGEMSRVMHDMLKVGKSKVFGIGYATIDKRHLSN